MWTVGGLLTLRTTSVWAAVCSGGRRTAGTRQRSDLENCSREPGKAQTVMEVPLNFVKVNPSKGSL